MDSYYGDEMNFDESQDFTDTEVEYVTQESDQITYLTDPQVSSGVDQDLPQVYPPKAAVPFETGLSDQEEAEIEYLQHEYAPTKAAGVTQDLIDLARNVAQGDERLVAQSLSQFSQSNLQRFTSPKVVGPILLFWAYRGRLSALERVLVGLIGAGAVVSGYNLLKGSQSSFSHPMQKKMSPYHNPLGGRY